MNHDNGINGSPTVEEELINVPIERRIVSTYLSRRPKELGYFASLGSTLFVAAFSFANWSNAFHLSNGLYANRSLVFTQSEYWRLFTATFCHADAEHLVSNSFLLFILGILVVGHFGFGIYFFLATFVAAATNALAILTYSADVRLIGASGLVYVLGGFWLTLFWLIQRQYKPINKSLRVIAVGLLLFFPTSFLPTTSYRTHALGFFLGILSALLFYFFKNEEFKRSEKYEYF
ncbi:MAG: hypothetical protein COT74_10890 [Bdellovibrionales bacterium CG10_big_fil_rev_8_21_14_0_10_45_34]|nr:MAG: hypothetical protein COT74_10890 [Bdellovibrionales bacterium CG10_big_fil_rev_8_21_14_0_10_45_34]